MDFTIEVLTADEESSTINVKVTPDARRYKEVIYKGECCYLDKYLNTLVRLSEMTKKMQDLPIYHLGRSIESTPAYAAERKEAVSREIATGEHIPPKERAATHSELDPTSSVRRLSFISVDICGSTSFRQSDPDGFDSAYRIFVQEIGALIGHFKGSILKTTGDGLIAYIDYPSFTSQCDATVDLGLSILGVLSDTINPALMEAGMKPLNVRVGADYGEAVIHKITIPATGYSNVDVASDALNRAVKIEKTCQTNEFRIGRSLYELIHVQYLERSEEVPFNGESVGIENYQAYRVR